MSAPKPTPESDPPAAACGHCGEPRLFWDTYLCEWSCIQCGWVQPPNVLLLRKRYARPSAWERPAKPAA